VTDRPQGWVALSVSVQERTPGLGVSTLRSYDLMVSGVQVCIPPAVRPSERRALLERGVAEIRTAGLVRLRGELGGLRERALATPLLIRLGDVVEVTVHLVTTHRRQWWEKASAVLIRPVELVVLFSGDVAHVRDRYGRPVNELQSTRTGLPRSWPG